MRRDSLRRQILAVTSGIVLSYLGAALAGYFLYRLSNLSVHQTPALARYVFNPAIALMVGLCVGALARSRAGMLSAFSLAPWVFSLLLARRQDSAHFLILLLLVILYLALGMASADVIFRARRTERLAN
jgi:hypothetical protein